MHDELTNFLLRLDLEQLMEIQSWVEREAKVRKSERSAKRALGPTGNLEQMATEAGLDISGLVRASKHY